MGLKQLGQVLDLPEITLYPESESTSQDPSSPSKGSARRRKLDVEDFDSLDDYAEARVQAAIADPEIVLTNVQMNLLEALASEEQGKHIYGLAQEFELPESTVRNALATLEEMGLVTRIAAGNTPNPRVRRPYEVSSREVAWRTLYSEQKRREKERTEVVRKLWSMSSYR